MIERDPAAFRAAALSSLVPPGTIPSGRPTRVAALEQQYESAVLATLIAERQRRAIEAEVAALLRSAVRQKLSGHR